MAFFLNALRSRWYHRYSVEDLAPLEPVQTVTCISLTDLSERRVRPLSVLSDQGPSAFTEKPRGSKRPLSSASQLSWEFLEEVKAGNYTTNCSDGGYCSMNDSLESLSRSNSIQNRSLRIWRKRRPWLANKKRLGEHGETPTNISPEQRVDKGSCESILESDEEKIQVNTTEETPSRISRPRSVHFDSLLSDQSSDDENKENPERTCDLTFSISIARQSSIHLKSWQLRRQRRAIKNMHKQTVRRTCPELCLHTQERQL